MHSRNNWDQLYIITYNEHLTKTIFYLVKEAKVRKTLEFLT